jgi:formylglycine-generating enzyme required for sulfatase activity
MGSPPDQPGREPNEGPQRRVKLPSFWIGRREVTWDEYELWASALDRSPSTPAVDAVARPTPPYCDMAFGMERSGHPAICMTQRAAATYCSWLSAKTGRHYRLPTEAEWEYACRAGSTTAYHFGDDPARLSDYAWYAANSEEEYHPVGTKLPNPWGLYDMHGNVAEWVLDQLRPYADLPDGAVVPSPLAEPTDLHPLVVRGGSWQDAAPSLRSAARRGSDPSWNEQDPQIPKSVWYLTDALFVGFRVVRVAEPPAADGSAPPR